MPSALPGQLGVVYFLQQDSWHPCLWGKPETDVEKGNRDQSKREARINDCRGIWATWIISGESKHLGRQEDLCRGGWICPCTCTGICSIMHCHVIDELNNHWWILAWFKVAIIIAGKNVPAVVSLTILAVMLYGRWILSSLCCIFVCQTVVMLSHLYYTFLLSYCNQKVPHRYRWQLHTNISTEAYLTQPSSSMFSGVFSNQADLAPNFAGTLMALTNMLATIPGILVPTLVGIMTHGTDGLAPWHTGELKVQWNAIIWKHLTSLDCAVFGMTAGILLFEVVLFSIFGKADTQVGCKISWL